MTSCILWHPTGAVFPIRRGERYRDQCHCPPLSDPCGVRQATATKDPCNLTKYDLLSHLGDGPTSI